MRHRRTFRRGAVAQVPHTLPIPHRQVREGDTMRRATRAIGPGEHRKDAFTHGHDVIIGRRDAAVLVHRHHGKGGGDRRAIKGSSGLHVKV